MSTKLGHDNTPPPIDVGIVPTGPIEADPMTGRTYLPRADRLALLREVLDDVQLGAYDQRMLEWVASWDGSTALTIASWIRRARLAGTGQWPPRGV